MNHKSIRHASTNGGIIATSDPRASEVGRGVLVDGGNCIDAAIAAAAAINVVEPYNSHLGGDAFLLYYSASEKKVTALNGSGAAPFGARLQDFLPPGAGTQSVAHGAVSSAQKSAVGGRQPQSETIVSPLGIPLRGIRAATVPGQVHTWFTAHSRWGKLPMDRLLAPAIALASDGFEVSKTLAFALAQATDCYDQPGFAEQFLSDGKPPAAGQVIRQPNVARALQLLAKDGVDVFYRGPIAKALVQLSRQQGGWFEPQDLAAHRTWLQQPIAYDYNGYTILEQPAPSQGVIVLQCLALANQLGIRDLPFDDPDRVHLMIEILKACYADRFRWWADPAFTRLPLERMLSAEYLAERAKLVSRDHAMEYPAGDLAPGKDTTYLAVADAEGNALSYIQSVFHSFGCGVVEPTYGILLNNRMNGFTLEKDHPNVLYPGKRPVHTLNTYMVLRPDPSQNTAVPLIIGGTPGGPSQVQWNFQVLSGLLDMGMPIEQAAAAPRWSWSDGLAAKIESDIGEPVLSVLRGRGHQLDVTQSLAGGGRVQLIHIDPVTGQRSGACDPRVEGAVLTTERR